MFLWTLSWTSNLLLALLTSTTQWDSYWDLFMEVIFDLLVWFPNMILFGHICTRIAATISVPKPLRSSVPPALWTPFCQFVAADLVVFIHLLSVSGKLNPNQPINTSGWNENWGWNAPFMSFTIRLILSALGINLGESFFPLALTGGIACGKSTVSQLFRKRNFLMIDADKIGHQILLPPWHADLQKEDALISPFDSVFAEILTTFADDNKTKGEGSAVAGVNEHHPLLDDKKFIDRAKLGAKVFANPEDRKKLNAITHKRIFYCLLKNIVKGIYMGETSYQYVCAEIPLLFESGAMRHVFGLVLCVACTPTQQLQRLKKRNPEMKPEECQNRIDSQMPMTEKVKMADIVIWNDKNFEPGDKEGREKQDKALEAQVDLALKKIQQRVGVFDTNLTSVLVLLSGSMVASSCFKLYMGTV